jgi:hypothetical protein
MQEKSPDEISSKLKTLFSNFDLLRKKKAEFLLTELRIWLAKIRALCKSLKKLRERILFLVSTLFLK